MTGTSLGSKIFAGAWGRIQRKTWCMGPYARVDLNPMPESTLSPIQGLLIWPLDTVLVSERNFHENVLQFQVRPETNLLPILLPLAIASLMKKIRLENLARNLKEEGRHLVLLFRPTSHATVKPWPSQSSTQSRQAQIMHFLIILL